MPRGRKKATAKKESDALKSRLDAVCSAVAKACPSEWSGGDPVVSLRAKKITSIPTYKSGSIALDRALGSGYAWGRIIEVYGPESSGKSTLMLHAIANVQQANPENLCALVDSENSFDALYARQLGVDTDNLLVSQPDSGEHALNIMMELIRNDVKLVIVDSVAALTPRDMFAGQIGDATIGKHARLMSEGLRSLNTLLSKKQASVIFTNQIRTLIGTHNASMAGSTTGGKALRFYASQRIELRRIGSDKSGDEIVNNIVKAKVAKNKIAPPFQECTFKIRFGKGVDPIEQVIDFAMDFDLIEKAGSWLTIDCIDQKLQGREKLYTLLEEDSDSFDKLNTVVTEKIEEEEERKREKIIKRRASSDSEPKETPKEAPKEEEEEPESAVVEEDVQAEKEEQEIEVSEV
jgi:recombination protein RecA